MENIIVTGTLVPFRKMSTFSGNPQYVCKVIAETGNGVSFEFNATTAPNAMWVYALNTGREYHGCTIHYHVLKSGAHRIDAVYFLRGASNE